MLTRDDQTAAKRILDVSPPVELSTRAREKPGGRVAIEAGEKFPREVGGAVLRADELNTRAKAASPETLTARETALEQAQPAPTITDPGGGRG